MVICFIFVKYLTEEGCLCLTINEQGDIVTPLQQRNFTDIQLLQANAQTTVVAPAEQFSFHRIALPWLPDKKARAAIPYALEEKLAENVENLHFSFDRQYYEHGHYLVAVCTKQYINELMTTMHQTSIDFHTLTVDWFALNNNDVCITNQGLLVHDNGVFCGFLNSELAPLYLQGIDATHNLYGFTDTDSHLLPANTTVIDETFLTWVSLRLQKTIGLNICQGQLHQKGHHKATQYWSIAATIMTSLFLISWLSIHLITLHNLNTHIKNTDKKIAVIYHQFFPEAQQVISPRFRIEQLIKSTKNEGNNAFWLLLNEFSLATQKIDTTIEQLRYQNQQLQVMLVSKDFNTLETLQNYLQQAQIKVKQSQAASRDNHVLGTLELTL